MLSRKGKQKFEEKRRETLDKYQATTGSNVAFELASSPESSSTTTYPFKIDPRPLEEEKSAAPTQQPAQDWKEEQRKRELEQQQREEEENKMRVKRIQEVESRNRSASAAPAVKLNWRQERELKEREMKERAEEEERKKREKISLQLKAASSPSVEAASSPPKGAQTTGGQESPVWKPLPAANYHRTRAASTSFTNVYSSPVPRSPGSPNWRQIREQKEQEEKLKAEEEEKKRLSKVSKLSEKSDEVKRFEELQIQKEEQLRKQLEEQEKKKAMLTTTYLLCSGCSAKMEKKDVQYLKGEPHCADCARKAAFKGPKCHSCGDSLGSKVVTASNRKYHPECLVCAGCKNQLTGGYRTAFNKMWCTQCQPGPQ